MAKHNLSTYLALSPLFENLGTDVMSDLEDYLELVNLTENETLFEQGDSGECMYVLIEGNLDVGLLDAQDKEFKIGEEYMPGTSIGEISLVSGQPRAVSLTARSDSKLVRLSKDGFNLLVYQRLQLPVGSVFNSL
jgi:NTE family protein